MTPSLFLFLLSFSFFSILVPTLPKLSTSLNGPNYPHFLVGSARKRFWSMSFTNQMPRPNVQMKVMLAGICDLFRVLEITHRLITKYAVIFNVHQLVLAEGTPIFISIHGTARFVI